MRYYKITNEKECHYGMQYKDGLNEDILPFNPSGECEPGGIYFAREDILAFLYGKTWIREVNLPEGEKVYEEPSYPRKWKAHRVILGKRERITGEVINRLIAEGANIHANIDAAIRWAAENGHTDTVKLLLENGADVHADNDAAIRRAAENGHTDTVKLLLENGADVHALYDAAIRRAAENGHTDTVKLLLENGADVHAWYDAALRWAAENGHTDTVKVLKEYMEREDAGENIGS